MGTWAEAVRPRQRIVHAWLLPLLFVVLAYASFQHPGDGYGMWATGAIAGTWPMLVGADSSDMGGLLPWALAFGAAFYLVLGLVLDRMRSRLRWLLLPWAAVAGLLIAITLAFPPRTFGQDRLAYVLFALDLGLLVATVVALLVTAVGKDLARLDDLRPPGPPPGPPPGTPPGAAPGR